MAKEHKISKIFSGNLDERNRVESANFLIESSLKVSSFIRVEIGLERLVRVRPTSIVRALMSSKIVKQDCDFNNSFKISFCLKNLDFARAFSLSPALTLYATILALISSRYGYSIVASC